MVDAAVAGRNIDLVVARRVRLTFSSARSSFVVNGVIALTFLSSSFDLSNRPDSRFIRLPDKRVATNPGGGSRPRQFSKGP
jgi:hypothetical protein